MFGNITPAACCTLHVPAKDADEWVQTVKISDDDTFHVSGDRTLFSMRK
jgi:hypothetical protein